ncbi:BRO1-like domain-containing protein [Phakopsora pachyrhizi]|uniref:pH-response regulator protein palC n=1 Tax=Phakopsora pachyrhizi TaxID=170000 RepID=A0AAV0BGE5_PHAPC|nr:BRO1-like domain-containing protein [Phakopsora pachyrhizi]CAH7685465.1 BRO1-like domain-domain-containing protein [Phakopsora pachyrhizi]
MSFLYPIPTTSSINLQHILTDPTGSRTGQLACANASRASMRTALKRCSSVKYSGGETDWMKTIKAIEDYLPHLLGLTKAIESDKLLITNEPVFTWRSTLSSRRVSAPPRISLSSFHFELSFVLFSLALSISNNAHSISASIGSYELGTEQDRQSGDFKLSQAVEALCRASGLLDHLSQSILPNWENQHSDGIVNLRSIRPPELSRESTAGLAQLTLADAEKFAIRRLLSRASMELHNSPGSGIPKSHPSPLLLAKLELNISKLYSNCKDCFKLSTGFTELTGSIKEYVYDQSVLSLARAYKWLAVDVGEKLGKFGEAIGWCQLAKDVLKELIGSTKKSTLVIRNRSITSNRADRKSKIESELDQLDNFLKVYERLNRTVTFETVPSSTNLLLKVPEGRSALNPKSFNLSSIPIPSSINYNNINSNKNSSNYQDDDSDDEEYNLNPNQNNLDYALKDTYY